MKTYTVKNGDNLESISRKVYGSPEYATHILKHNPGLADPNQLAPLQKLHIPALTVDQGIEHLKREIFNA